MSELSKTSLEDAIQELSHLRDLVEWTRAHTSNEKERELADFVLVNTNKIDFFLHRLRKIFPRRKKK